MQTQHTLLKFVDIGNTFPTRRGIRTFPHHASGVSRESPDHFHQQHTLVHPQTYLYQHEEAPQFEYHSQQGSLGLWGSSGRTKERKQEGDLDANRLKFHLKKGRLGEFLDKNAWMKTVYVMSGQERSQQSRELSNIDRQHRLQSLRPSPASSLRRPRDHTRSLLAPQDLILQKARIRQRRNQEAQKKACLSQHSLSGPNTATIQAEAVKSKMSRTNKEWFRSPRARIGRELSMHEPPLSRLSNESQLCGQLEQWQRKTCRAKWCYQRPKLDSLQNEQEKIFE